MAMQNREFLAYLEELGARHADPVRGFFGPQSVMWQVSREAIIYINGIRALLFQLAHPKVAQGVADHSNFQGDALGRLRRTFDAVHAMVFGTRDQAIGAALKTYAIHSRVRGTLAAPLPALADSDYHANAPDLLIWVYATLIENSVFAHQLYLGSREPAFWEQFYAESKLFAQLFSIDPAALPASLADFQRWMAHMLESETITVTPVARSVARSLFTGSPFLRANSPLSYLIAAGSMPPRLRAAFGLRWGAPVRLGYRSVLALARLSARTLPERLRILPVARSAELRCRS